MFHKQHQQLVCVVIPCYKVTQHIRQVIEKIGPEVNKIYAVDDCCPDNSGEYIQAHISDPRVQVLFNKQNLGVGGAVMTGYRAAVADNQDIVVKIDGDGQMNPDLIPLFIKPLIEGWADYTKGNRFYNLTHIKRMPKVRIFGNAGLSFMSKLSTGYWNIFDPTNGYTAIKVSLINHIQMEKIDQRFFFETDILFRLSILRAVVVDIPMDAVYGDEVSNLKIQDVLFSFSKKHVINFSKRIFYNYFLRDMTAASFELIFGSIFLIFGLVFGGIHWRYAISSGVQTPLGTIMVASLTVLFGLQLLLAFLNYDTSSTPTKPISSFFEHD